MPRRTTRSRGSFLRPATNKSRALRFCGRPPFLLYRNLVQLCVSPFPRLDRLTFLEALFEYLADNMSGLAEVEDPKEGTLSSPGAGPVPTKRAKMLLRFHKIALNSLKIRAHHAVALCKHVRPFVLNCAEFAMGTREASLHEELFADLAQAFRASKLERLRREVEQIMGPILEVRSGHGGRLEGLLSGFPA